MKVVKKQSKKIFLSAMILIILVTILTFMISLILSPQIKLEEKQIITLPVGTPYQEPGYKATFLKKDITKTIKITGIVNHQKLGTYFLQYETKYLWLKNKKTRIIKVVDKESPTIELTGDINLILCPNSTYQELGYQAFDNYDKDITQKVKITNNQNEIIYEVEDSSQNKTIQKRTLHYEDTKNPEITLTGNQNIAISQYNNYQEPGYQAFDNCDGDITQNVKITTNLNTTIPGTYQITYEVTDSAHNKTTVTRTIQVIKKISKETGTIYLTFDDGPSNTITREILDVLKQENVKATFFVINHSDQLDELIKREYEEGHTVGLHSYTHDYSNIYQSQENYFKDLEKIQTKVKRITGKNSTIIRFPGGSSNTVSQKYQIGIMKELSQKVLEKGYHYFDWNVDSGDAGQSKTSQEIYNQVVNHLSPNQANVVLMHDVDKNTNTLKALKDIIQYGKQNGYRFQNITEETTMVTHRVVN